MNTDQVTKRYYGIDTSTRDSSIVQNRIHWMVKQARGKRVLDAGCSQGITALLLAREGFEVVGVDIETEAIEFAKNELLKESAVVQQRVKFSVEDLSVPVTEKYGTFDTIILGEVIEHLAHPKRIIENLSKALNPGGIIIITVPFGILPFHDHKVVYQVSNFIELVDEHLSVSHLDIHNKYLRAILDNNSDNKKLAKKKYSWKRYLQDTEIAYTDLQQSTSTRVQEFKDRNKLLEQRIENKKSFSTELSKVLRQHDSRLVKEVTNLKNQHGKEVASLKNQYDKPIDQIFKSFEKKLADANDKNKDLRKEKNQLKSEVKHLNNSLIHHHSLLQEHSKQLESIPHAVGTFLCLAISNPGKNTLLLPARLISIAKEALKRRRLRKNPEHSNAPSDNIAQEASNSISGQIDTSTKVKKAKPLDNNSISELELDPNTMLFMPINGAGLGHLTRSMAVAKRVVEQEPQKKIIFFTTSTALPIIHREGFIAYHIPPQKMHNNQLETKAWNNLLTLHLSFIAEKHRPATIVFDGTSPYGGLRRFFLDCPQIKKIWIKRGLYKSVEVSEKLKKFTELFDRTISPGEYNQSPELKKMSDADQNATSVNPIILLKREEVLSREDACRILNLNPQKKTVYVQLGAGNINDTQEITQRVLDAISTIPELQIIIAESLISKSQKIYSGDYRTVRDFPNSKYYKAFDVAILAAGYNSVNESVYFNLPSIFLPNDKTISDDQVARAEIATRYGLSLIHI